VAKNNPEHVSEFHDHSLTELLDKTTNDRAVQKYFQGYFYPTDQAALRAELKREIQFELGYDNWPSWLTVTEQLDYKTKKDKLLKQYDLFIEKRSNSSRMPIALYFKAILSEYSPDIRAFGEDEILHFYSDYPFERSKETWLALYRDFGSSPESIEARWRIARHWAGSRGIFDQADKLLVEAQTMAAEQLKLIREKQAPDESIFSLFQVPAKR